VQASRFGAGLMAQHADIPNRLRAERYFVALSADGSPRRSGGLPISDCDADAAPGVGHGHLTFGEAGASGDRGG